MFVVPTALLALWWFAASAAADSANDTLPGDVLPVSYELHVATDLARSTFTGRACVTVRAVVPTCRVTMNAAAGMLVAVVRVTDRETGRPLTVAWHRLTANDQRLTVELHGTEHTRKCLLPHREYVVDVRYESALRDDGAGYYRGSYADNGRDKPFAMTQFFPTYARSTFPCFDEPKYKTPYKISIMRRWDQTSLSNMPLLSSVRTNNTDVFWDHFQETRPLSTYMVHWFVGEVYTVMTDDVTVYAPKGDINRTAFLVETSPGLLQAMGNFTGIKNKLPSLDLLVVPSVHIRRAGSWETRTIMESPLLLPENALTKEKEFLIKTMQYQLSRQWFGSLVSCEMWDYLWINEGLATYFQYFAAAMAEPDWRFEDMFVYEVHQVVLDSDTSSTHAITTSVGKPHQIIGNATNVATYMKVAAVLRMLRYKAVTPNKLWAALESAVQNEKFVLGGNVTVTQFMKSWVEQAGYPWLRVKKVNGTIIVTQEWFSTEFWNDMTPKKWIIGLTYTTERRKDFANVSPKIWLKEKVTVIPNQTESGWYIFNLQSTGFYRVNYDEHNWNALINQLAHNHTAIHVLNRAQLINDAFKFATIGKENFTLPLRLSEYLIKENDIIPWYTAKREFERLLIIMRAYPTFDYFKAFVGHLADSMYEKLESLATNPNKIPDRHSIMVAWNAFSVWACKLDGDRCTKSALSYYNMWLEGIKIPIDIKDAALCTAVKYGDLLAWDTVFNAYIGSKSEIDRRSALSALACSLNPNILARYLEYLFKGHDGGPIRPQDYNIVYETLASTPYGISALINFLTNNLVRIFNEIPNGEIVAKNIFATLVPVAIREDEALKVFNLTVDWQHIPDHIRNMFSHMYSRLSSNWPHLTVDHPDIGHWARIYTYNHGLMLR